MSVFNFESIQFSSFRRHFPFPFYDFYLHIVWNEVIKKRKKNNHGRNVFPGDARHGFDRKNYFFDDDRSFFLS